ncbi:hypothetical protein F0U61_52695 [Archangium violaceum]|uniref:hypothetical protein n=1 Tax=Archangium violaceum TaxID=83451 RepID=UPI002B2DE51D|nr:hypothetical protein F0U61_52695 [Archangium violaceum]
MRLYTTLLLGLLTGCATSASSSKTEAPAEGDAAAQPASTPEPKADIEALSKRELATLTRQQVSAPDGSFTAEVEAAAAPTFQEQQGVLVLSVPLGTRSPMTCFVYSEPLDAGGALYRLMEMAGQRTDIQRARTTEVRLIGDSPAVYAEALYLADTPRGKAAGLAKMMVHTHDQVPLVCTHDEMGYSESFLRISSGLAGSIKSAAEKPQAPRYSEFSVIRVQGHPVGFEKRVTRDASGGAKLTEVEMSLFFPRSQKEMVVQDTVSTELSDKDGRLVARDYARATNGELDIQMSLEQVKGREYHYEGKHSGKDLNGNFTSPDELLSELGSARVVREQLLSGKKKELTIQIYSPSANPAAPIPQVLRKEAGARELTAEMASLKVSLTVDAQGLAEKVTIPVGSMQMVQERVSVSGTP